MRSFDNAPLVSVVCITYNHGEYLRDALDGFLSQETDFPFEIIVHDDCSTDGTTDILREYAEKYPELIVPLYEEQNCYSRGIRVIHPMMTDVAKGKYIAICEGDDFWCDPKKLQRQIEYLEQHEDCSLVLHNGYGLDIQSGKKTPIDPYEKSGIISTHDAICEKKNLPPTASMVFRRQHILEMPEFFLNAGVGDRPRRMYLALRGHIYYMHEKMCVYRMNVAGSFSQRVKNEAVRKECLDKMLAFFDNYDQFTEQKYAREMAYVRSREYFHYYMRGNQKWRAYRTMYYRQTFSNREKLRAYLGLFLPDSVKAYIKGKLPG